MDMDKATKSGLFALPLCSQLSGAVHGAEMQKLQLKAFIQRPKVSA